MAGETDPRTAAMAFWGTISAAASEHAGASVAAQRVAAEAARLGAEPSFETYQAAMTLYAQATRLQYSSEALGEAPNEYAITGEYLAPLPYGQTGAGSRVLPEYHVRVEYTFRDEAGEHTDYITLRYTGGLPGTVGDLRADAETIAAGLIPSYGRAFVGMGAIQIGEL